MVYPSNEEGFANSLAEAWLAGVPTVATAGVGALAEAPWCDCAVTVQPRCSPADLRTAIRKAFKNETLVRTARRAAASLTVEMTVDAWQDYLERIVRGPRRTRVMALLPDLSIGGMQSWLLTLMRHTPNIDWVCLGVVSELNAFEGDPPLIEEFLSEGCPVIGIPNLLDADVRRRLERAMRQTRPDVVIQAGVRHLDRKYPECGIPLVTVSHGSSSSEWGIDVLANSCHCASRYVAVSKTAVDAFNETYRSRVEVIPNGVEPPPSPEVRAEMRAEARKELGLKPHQIAVGFLGRLSPEKNPTTVVRAVAELPDNFQALFVGPPKPGMLEEIRNITDRFQHIPGVRPGETGQWLAAMDVLVCPSEFESFGLAIVEAWTFGVPVVATPVGVIEELQDDTDVAVTVPFTAASGEWPMPFKEHCGNGHSAVIGVSGWHDSGSMPRAWAANGRRCFSRSQKVKPPTSWRRSPVSRRLAPGVWSHWKTTFALAPDLHKSFRWTEPHVSPDSSGRVPELRTPDRVPRDRSSSIDVRPDSCSGGRRFERSCFIESCSARDNQRVHLHAGRYCNLANGLRRLNRHCQGVGSADFGSPPRPDVGTK